MEKKGLVRGKMEKMQKRKLEAENVYYTLVEKLGEEKFKRVFNETSRRMRAQLGFDPPREDVILTVADEMRLQELATAVSKAIVKHDGGQWRVYYYPVDHFEDDLPLLGAFLESLGERGEVVVALVPNVGFVKTSLVLGTSFQGVKGFAVIVRKPYGKP